MRISLPVQSNHNRHPSMPFNMVDMVVASFLRQAVDEATDRATTEMSFPCCSITMYGGQSRQLETSFMRMRMRMRILAVGPIFLLFTALVPQHTGSNRSCTTLWRLQALSLPAYLKAPYGNAKQNLRNPGIAIVRSSASFSAILPRLEGID
jgi:hypothetical protein